MKKIIPIKNNKENVTLNDIINAFVSSLLSFLLSLFSKFLS